MLLLKPEYFCCPFKNKLRNIFLWKCTISLFSSITNWQIQRGFHIFHVVFCLFSFFYAFWSYYIFIGFIIWIDLEEVTIILIILWTRVCSCYKWVKVYIHQACIGMQAWSDWILPSKDWTFSREKSQLSQKTRI